MARAFPLETVRMLAQHRTASAARELQGHAGRLRGAEAKLDQLQRYLAEYRLSRSAALVQGLTAARLREFDLFLARLVEAMGAQSLEVERARVTWEASRAHWVEAQKREKAMDALAERHAAEEQIRENRRDRKAQDEFAARTRPNPMKIRIK
jgi:flagellar FliJ protein